MISGKWWVQFMGFHDLMCLGDMAEPPFEDGELVKVTIERVVQNE